MPAARMIYIKVDADDRITATSSKPSPDFPISVDWNTLTPEQRKALVQNRAKYVAGVIVVLPEELPTNLPSTEELEAMEAIRDAAGAATPTNLTKAMQFVIRRLNLLG